jgi:thiamine-monophosphate kinase
MVENVHFFADVEPESLGHKLLAVNLSDLAAMGAEPFAVSLALTLPRVDNLWLQGFSQGFLALAREHNVDLIGGDTTAGPLTLTVQALGVVPKGQALLRSTAQVGDLVYVSGQIGNAGLGLKIKQGYACDNAESALRSFHKPQPRVQAGLALRGKARACIDISDGLAADLGHILQKSAVGACIDYAKLPLSAELNKYIELTGEHNLPLIAGDDYELCFTVPPQIAATKEIDGYCIGVIEAEPGLRIRRNGQLHTLKVGGYEHFS